MTESIFVRVQRVVSSGVDTVVEVAEQLSGSTLARQALREMDATIARTRDEADDALMKRLQAEHQLAAQRTQLSTLEQQARFALDNKRTDLAEAAIARQLEVERHIERLSRLEAECRVEEASLVDSLAALKLRKAQMQEQFESFQSAQRSAKGDTEAPRGPSHRADRKAERAEEAFDRAISAAGGVAAGRASPESASKVAEIEALQKAAAIAARLAALRGGEAEVPTTSRPGTRPRRSER